MLGHTHALTGLAAGAAAATLVLHEPLPSALTLTVLSAAFATFPDLDQTCSSAGRSLGPVSRLAAIVIRRVSGGHRHGTHSVAGVAAFTGLAVLASAFRADIAGMAGLALLVALALAAGLRALRVHPATGDVLALAGAAAVAVAGVGLALVPLACALGCAVHIAGDALTTEGVPLAWPFTLRRFWLLPHPMRFETGHIAERWAVAPFTLAVVALLAWHAVSLPGYLA